MMIFRHLITSIFLGLIFFVAAPAQTPTSEASAKKEKAALELEKTALEMLEQTVGDAATLKLQENRALIYAMAGDALWSKNEKRARQLFRLAANEIVQANNASADKSAAEISGEAEFGRMEMHNLRRMLLQTLAAHDAEMALEILQTTRPADVAAEMLVEATPAAGQNASPDQSPKRQRNYKVEQEIALEQSLAARAAEQDPQRAAKLVRESLSKGLSYEVMNSIVKIGAKDIELANKLLAETIGKLIEADFLKRPNEMFFAVNTLQTFAAPPRHAAKDKAISKLKLDEKTLKELANKIAESLLKANSFESYFAFQSAMPILEKLTPERIASLRQKQAALKKQMPENFGFRELPRSLRDPNAAPETLLADAAKVDAQMRGLFYQQAAQRAITAGEEEKLRPLLQNLPAGKDRDDAVNRLDSALAAKHLEAGRLEEARKIVERMNVGNSKLEQLVGLAVAAHRLNTKESRESALKLMDEARRMINDFPEDRDETEGLMKVAAGYAIVEPERAFTMLTPVIEQTNDLISAAAILAKFNKQNQIFRDGEIVMANGFSAGSAGFFRYGKELKMLAQADLGRTRALVERFRRQDVRAFINMFIVQAVLKEKIGLDGAVFGSFG